MSRNKKTSGDSTQESWASNEKQPRSQPSKSSDPLESNTQADPHPSQQLQYVVRFGSMRMLGVMTAQSAYRYNDEVVILSQRGTEMGTVLCEATPAAIDSMEEPTSGRILRACNPEDQAQWEHIRKLIHNDQKQCQSCIDALQLNMELVDIERILGGEKMVIYFLAPRRVDFRRLVRDLAKQFQTRIEMRQIGVRDEAKLLADYGDCGQPICCATFLSKMPPVSMKMAKLQKATLDPTKISGRCGRLKCCLRYEFDTYESLAKELPPTGSVILTREGNATVLGQDVLSSQLTVRTADNRRILVHADEVIEVIQRGTSHAKPGKRSPNTT